MPKKPVVTISVEGEMSPGQVDDLISDIPHGAQYSGTISSGEPDGIQVYELSVQGLSVAEAQAFLVSIPGGSDAH
jgi:hypothetical protein